MIAFAKGERVRVKVGPLTFRMLLILDAQVWEGARVDEPLTKLFD
jgi:hypothetical protein